MCLTINDIIIGLLSSQYPHTDNFGSNGNKPTRIAGISQNYTHKCSFFVVTMAILWM